MPSPSVPPSAARTRRALVALTTSAALGGTALLAGAGPASAAPADPDITGLVTNSAGAALAGIRVEAYTTPGDGTQPRFVTSTLTDATGRYTFTGLDPASLASSTNPAIATETEFKLAFSWSPVTPADYHSVGYLDRGLGGSRTVGAAGSVVVPANAVATAPTQALPTGGGVLLTVLGSTGAPVTSGGGDLYDLDSYDPLDSYVPNSGGYTGYDDDFYPDANGDGDPDAPVDGLVYLPGVEPGEYGVQAYGSSFNATTGVTTNFVSRFFGGNGSYPDAKAVKVAAGAFTPVTVQLSDKLTTVQDPRIIGNSSFGSKLKADPGTWLSQQGADFTYQWLRGSTPVATGDTYKVTKKDKGKKIRLVVTAYNYGYVGTATSDATSKVGEKSKVTVVAKRADGAVQVKVVVAKKKLAAKLGTPKGKVVLVTEDGTAASGKVGLKKGLALLKPRKKFAGEKLTVLYLGSGRLGSDTVAVNGGGKKK